MEEARERAILLARYIVETGDTVRGAAKQFGVSKSTVHSDVAKKLRRIDPALWRQADRVLQRNKDERHLRGGQATREKYRCRRLAASRQ
ncbi:MAG: sporulation transcriptional regulator SpoIIID [Oscillospiraceae bacterium]|nr:sporulation transcriptional regulator SpoIIID [Oscillospiraceae bacterium]